MLNHAAKELHLLVRKDAYAYADGPWWVAQCVEYDIVCQARTPEGIFQEFVRTLAARFAIAGQRGQADPFQTLRPAPAEVRELFERVRNSALRLDLPSELEIPGVPMHVGFQAQLAP